MTIYERIKQLRIEKGLSQFELAKLVGYEGRSAISKVEKGQLDISSRVLKKYADALGVSPAYLLFGEENKIDFGFENVLPVEKKRFPLLGKIACGEPIFADEERESYVEAGTEIDADFCLKCKGDSMTGARIFDGDIVFIRRQDMVENGEVAAVVIDDEATLKRVFYDPEKGKMVLQAENPRFQPLVYVGDELNEIRILGKAVAFQSDVK